MEHPLQSHFDRMVVLLGCLRGTFEDMGPARQQREFFEQYLDENELELALHIVCEYILESPASMIGPSVLANIEEAHRAMDLQDDCVEKIRLKISGNR
jgi:hypothetical protein